MEWLKKISDAIEYIDNNLDKEISIEEAANIACCSSFYFQRMFSYVADISLSEYIRQRKMTQAAFDLQSSDIKVVDAALKYGYASPTSFNRAFKSVHGISPIAARNNDAVLNAYLPIKLKVSVAGSSPMPYKIVEKEAIRIVGIRIRLTEDIEKNMQLAPEFWNKTLNTEDYYKLCSMSNLTPNGILGITAPLSPNEIYYYIAAATDKAVPTGMFEYNIPAATWVIFECCSSFKEFVQTTFKRFLTEWLPFSGYTCAYLPDIEVYPIENDNPSEGHTQVWIAIQKDKESIYDRN